MDRDCSGATENHPGANLPPSHLPFELLHLVLMSFLVDLHAQTAEGFSRLLDYRVKHVVCRCE